MRLFTLLIACFFTISGFSQAVIEIDTIGALGGSTNAGSTTDAKIDYGFTVYNVGDANAEFYWELIRDPNMPRDWAFTVCDAVICHPELIESSPCEPDFLNVLPAGESINYFKVGLNPYGVPGEAELTFRITSECAPGQTVLAETKITFSVAGQSSLEEPVLSDDMLIYPNPTSDRFLINNDSEVSEIVVFNIVGKRIMSERHRPGLSHDVSSLDKGIYLVRMLDENKSTLKVIRLTRE